MSRAPASLRRSDACPFDLRLRTLLIEPDIDSLSRLVVEEMQPSGIDGEREDFRKLQFGGKRHRERLIANYAMHQPLRAEFLDIIETERQGCSSPFAMCKSSARIPTVMGRRSAQYIQRQDSRTDRQTITMQFANRRFIAGEPMKLATKVEAGV